jgi:hypothetical protein
MQSQLRSRRWLLSLLLGLVPALAAAQAPPPQVVLAFHMAVDADGRPTSLEPPPGLPASIGQTVDAWAKGLRFVPASIDGVPQASTTYLRVRFDTSDPNAVKLLSAMTGPGMVAGEFPPPPENDAAAFFLVAFDPLGQVTGVEVDTAHSPMASKKFTRWAERYLRGFRFMPETVASQPVAGRVRIPLLYCHRSRRCAAELPELPGQPPVASGEAIADSVLKPAARTGE